jgi:hypothetical protein
MIASAVRAGLLQTLTAALAFLGLAIYVRIVIEADFDLANSALFPLAFLALPFGLAHLVLRRWAVTGRVVNAVLATGLILLSVGVLARNGIPVWWADAVTVVVAGLVAVLCLVVALLPAGEAHRSRDNGGVGRVASTASRDRKLIR